ncbi:MAG: gamma-glutamyltransferase [Thermaerobacterales bacterium]
MEQSVSAAPSTGGMAAVSSPHSLASDAGVEILAAGGNAFDATVAVALGIGVAEGYHSGIGGGAIILYRTADGQLGALQGRGTAPRELHRSRFFENNELQWDRVTEGPLSSIVPGLLASLHRLWRERGRLDWDRVCAPAVRLAEEGFPVDRFFADHFHTAPVKEKLGRHAGSAYLVPGDDGVRRGTWMKQHDLAQTMRRLATEGIEPFYQGDIGERIASHVQELGGVMTFDDLRQYQPSSISTASITYRGWTVAAPAFPCLGGIQVLQILKLLERFPLYEMGFASSEYLHVLLEAFKLAFAERAAMGADGIPLSHIEDDYLAELSERIQPGRTMPRLDDYLQPPEHGQHTSHFSVQDREGNAVSATQTVGSLWGSGVVVPGTGIIMNNTVSDFSLVPDSLTQQGVLYKDDGNLLAPGKMPGSNQSPIIAFRADGATVAVGAAGGPRIVSAVAQSLINHIDFGMSMADSLNAPRVHSHGTFVETEGWIARDTARQLEAWGHDLRATARADRVLRQGGDLDTNRPKDSGRSMGCVVQAVASDPEGNLDGAADPRGSGSAPVLGGEGKKRWVENSGYIIRSY